MPRILIVKDHVLFNTVAISGHLLEKHILVGLDLRRNGLGYGRLTFSDVAKWNCVFREKDVKPGAYTYRCLLALGSVAEVQKTLRRLSQLRQDYQD